MNSYIVFVTLLCLCHGLLGFDGVCGEIKNISQWVMKKVPYTIRETYKERCYAGMARCKKTRISVKHKLNYERQWTTRDERHCCDGYIQNFDMTFHSELACTPVCFPQCDRISAYCSRPDICSCNEGYIRESDTNCSPVCSNGCLNGVCSSPENCVCHEGYIKIGGVCSPICEEACINGSCVAPDTCQCNVGFRNVADSSKECAPYCSRGCTNGFCREPEMCECDDGYELKDEVCVPVCLGGCDGGICEEPDVCVCPDGYIYMATGTCEPECNECINGKCVAPYTCECLPGYSNNSMNCGLSECNSTACEPVCDNGCKNGVCFEPNKCKCNSGYIEDVNSTCVEIVCDDCVEGVCIRPGVCQCHEGYSGPTCQPVCTECVNAICRAPEECECLPGFVKASPNSCELVSTVTQMQSTTTENIELSTTTELDDIATSEVNEIETKTISLEYETTNNSENVRVYYWIYGLVGFAIMFIVIGIAFYGVKIWKNLDGGSYNVKESDNISIVYTVQEK